MTNLTKHLIAQETKPQAPMEFLISYIKISPDCDSTTPTHIQHNHHIGTLPKKMEASINTDVPQNGERQLETRELQTNLLNTNNSQNTRKNTSQQTAPTNTGQNSLDSSRIQTSL